MAVPEAVAYGALAMPGPGETFVAVLDGDGVVVTASPAWALAAAAGRVPLFGAAGTGSRLGELAGAVEPVRRTLAAVLRGQRTVAVVDPVPDAAGSAPFRFEATRLVDGQVIVRVAPADRTDPGATPLVVYGIEVGGAFALRWVGPEVADLIGVPAEDVLTNPDIRRRIAHPEDRERYQDAVRAAARDGRATVTYRVRAADGRIVWLRDDLRLTRDAAGRADEVVGAVRPVAPPVDPIARAGTAGVTSDVFWVLDAASHQVLHLSAGFEDVWGLSRERAYADWQSWVDAVHPEDRERVAGALAVFVEGAAEDVDVEFRIVRPDGTLRVLHSRGFASDIGLPDSRRLAGVTRDVTVRREVERIEFGYRQSLQRLLDAIAAHVWHVDLAGRVVWMNAAARAATGMGIGDAVGRPITMSGLDWAQPERQHEEIAAVVRMGRPRLAQIEACRLQGEERWFSVDRVPLATAGGAIRGVMLFLYDITSLRATEALIAREKRFSALVASLPDAVWQVDDTGRIVILNPMGQGVVGPVLDPMRQGAYWLERLHPEDRDRVAAAYGSLLSGGGPLDLDYRIRLDAGWRWLHSRSALVSEQDGRRVAEGIVTDVTPQKHLEETLRTKGRHDQALAELARLALESTDMAVVIDAAARLTRQALEAHAAGVYEIDPDGRSLVLRTTAGPYRDRKVGRIVRRGPRPAALALRPGGLRAPIETKDGPFGVLDVMGNPGRDRRKQDLGLVTAMARVLGEAVGRARVEERFRGLVESGPDAMVILDGLGTVVLANAEAERMFGRPQADMVGRPAADFLVAIAPSAIGSAPDRLRVELEAVGRRADGSTLPLEVTFSWIGSGGIGTVVLAARDVTARQRTEGLMRLLVEGVSGATGQTYLERLVALVADAIGADLVALGRWSADRRRVTNLATWFDGTVLPPTEYDVDENMLTHAVLAGETVCIPDGVDKLVPTAGLVRVARVRAYVAVPLRDPDGTVRGVLLAAARRPFTDVDRTRSLVELAGVRAAGELGRLQAEALLRDAAHRIQTAQEDERRRVARELHDEFGHLLTGLKFGLAWLAKQLDAPTVVARDRMRERLGALDALTDRTIASVRRLAAALRPDVLDDLGLVAALQWLASELTSRAGVAATVAIDPRIDLEGIDGPRATALFRIAQEALTNVARYAQATRVEIHMQGDAAGVTLTVHDDGRGVPVDAEGAVGLGIRGMEERAVLFDGRLSVTPGDDGGTRVTAFVPRAVAGRSPAR